MSVLVEVRYTVNTRDEFYSSEMEYIDEITPIHEGLIREFYKALIVSEYRSELEAKKGKDGGGYCTFVNDYKAPFIFSNFNGTSGDVDVLTHEVGHAFQVYRSRNQEMPEYIWPTYEACEIHSMSMEFLAWPWMENFFKEDVDKYKSSHLSSSLLFIPYGVFVDGSIANTTKSISDYLESVDDSKF